MTEKMTLLFVKQTGHVFAAVTRAAEPESDISASSLAKGGLLARNLTASNLQFVLPEDSLDALTVDFNEALILRPRAYMVDPTDQLAKEVPNVTVQSVSLTTTDVTVQLAAAVTADSKVWVEISGGNLTKPRIVTGTIPNGASSAVLQIATLESGSYDVLALVAGHRRKVDTVNIP